MDTAGERLEEREESPRCKWAPNSMERQARSNRSRHKSAASRNNQRMRVRTTRLTVALFCLVGAISSLTPFLSLHLTNRTGLLLFESEILQLRSTLYSVIICFIVLVSLGILLFVLIIGNQPGDNFKRKNLLLQRILRLMSGSLGIISVLAYLSIALIVPHIKQTQRMPLATFDCQANEISIENCQQQFASTSSLFMGSASATSSDEPLKQLKQLFLGDLNANNERLIKKLDCLKYNHRDFRALKVPTRFLLHKCGLVCRPHRQQLHQFSDDLNGQDDFNKFPQPQQKQQQAAQNQNSAKRPLVAPYNQEAEVTRTGQEPASEFPRVLASEDSLSNSNLVTLKICFSGEVDGLGSNYKRFCIENLTGEGSRAPAGELSSATGTSQTQLPSQQNTMTVGQLNAILARITSTSDELSDGENAQEHSSREALAARQEQEQNFNSVAGSLLSSTHYVNPIVQFESHFKNWPHLKSRQDADTNTFYGGSSRFSDQGATNNAWCKFKPIPPFIVNNKPFSDIQCSLEHEYLIRTKPQGTITKLNPVNGEDKIIYLRKSAMDSEEEQQAVATRERCSIQCKVNILYQVHLGDSALGDELLINKGDYHLHSGDSFSDKMTNKQAGRSFYLPLKPCLFLVGEGDKTTTANYYLFFRSMADSSLLLAFILVDLLLLVESIDTHQFHLEGKKIRLFSLLLALTLLPIIVALLFDLTASWLPNYVQHGRREGYLVAFLNEHLIPAISDALSSLYKTISADAQHQRALNNNHKQPSTFDSTTTKVSENFSVVDKWSQIKLNQRDQNIIVVDNYLVPFFVYALLMFTFALSVLKLPLVASDACSLIRATSTEELGLASTAPKLAPKPAFRGSQSLGEGGVLEEGKQRDWSKDDLESVGTREQFKSSSQEAASQVFVEKEAQESEQTSRRRVVLFAILTLFMGLQFNLGQIIQTPILIESFDLKNELKQQESRQATGGSGGVALSFVLAATHSSGALFLFLVAIIFSDELSGFLAEFSIFKLSKIMVASKEPQLMSEGRLGRKRSEARFKIHLSVSLIAYAVRYFILANLVQAARMRWPLVFLFQVAELLNFPLTWFVLTARGHQLMGEHPALRRLLSDCGHRKQRVSVKLLNIHIVAQSALAFIYFVLARFLALFVHTLHASLHLHSDNINWFIETFYKDAMRKSSSGARSGAAARGALRNVSGSAAESAASKQEAGAHDDQAPLFSPLPGERQTHLHASRLFIKYNSLICFVFGLTLLGSFVYLKYQLWLEEKRPGEQLSRRKALEGGAEHGGTPGSEPIVDRLSLDLARIKSTNKTLRHSPGCDKRAQITSMAHVPIKARGGAKEQLADGHEEAPRARIHFRYDLGRRHRRQPPRVRQSQAAESSSSSLSSSSSSPAAAQCRTPPVPPELDSGAKHETVPTNSANFAPANQLQQQQSARELRFPISREERQIEESSSSANERQVERVTRTISKRIELLEEGENWSLGEKDEAGPARVLPGSGAKQGAWVASVVASPPPPEFADGYEQYASDSVALPPDNGDKRQPQMGKRISFAPTATLIDPNDASPGQSSGSLHRHTIMATRASSADKSDTSATTNSSGSARRASPEPSIDDDDDAYSGHANQVTADDSMTKGGRKLQMGEADSIDDSH